MAETLIFTDLLVFLDYVFKTHYEWAMIRFVFGSCIGLLILLFAVWIDFGFVKKIFVHLCSSKRFPAENAVTPQLDLEQIEEDDSLESLNRIVRLESQNENVRTERAVQHLDLTDTFNGQFTESTPVISNYANISRIPRTTVMPISGVKFNNPAGRYYTKPKVLSRGPSAFRIYDNQFRNRLSTGDYAALPLGNRSVLRSRISIPQDEDNDSLYDNSEYGIRIGTWKNDSWRQQN